MALIIFADKDQHGPIVHTLFLEHLSGVAGNLMREYGIEYPAEHAVEQDMAALDKFMPPKGRLLLAYIGDSPAGVGCLRELEWKTGEVQRVYVRPDFRGQGVGKALLRKLIDESIVIGYTRLRLESSRFMTEAHHLYRSMGFAEIEPFDQSEIPEEFRSNQVFMEKTLSEMS